MESQHPGFAYDMIKGILRKAEVQGQVDMNECILRLEGLNNSDGRTPKGLSAKLEEERLNICKATF